MDNDHLVCMMASATNAFQSFQFGTFLGTLFQSKNGLLQGSDTNFRMTSHKHKDEVYTCVRRGWLVKFYNDPKPVPNPYDMWVKEPIHTLDLTPAYLTEKT